VAALVVPHQSVVADQEEPRVEVVPNYNSEGEGDDDYHEEASSNTAERSVEEEAKTSYAIKKSSECVRKQLEAEVLRGGVGGVAAAAVPGVK
jgi:hypothetical protein